MIVLLFFDKPYDRLTDCCCQKNV